MESAVFAFFDQHPNAWIFATGSTASRTRLYQMGIAKYYIEISSELGQLEENWYPFEKNQDYLAFVAKLRIS